MVEMVYKKDLLYLVEHPEENTLSLKDRIKQFTKNLEACSDIQEYSEVILSLASDLLYMRVNKMANVKKMLDELSEDLPSFSTESEIDFKAKEVALERDIRRGNSSLMLSTSKQKHSRWLAYVCTVTLCALPIYMIATISASDKPLDLANAFSALTAIITTLVVTLSTIVLLFIRSTSGSNSDTGTLVDKARIGEDVTSATTETSGLISGAKDSITDLVSRVSGNKPEVVTPPTVTSTRVEPTVPVSTTIKPKEPDELP